MDRIPDRDGCTVAIRRLPTVERRQGQDGVDREPGDHLGLLLPIALPRFNADVAHESLEHLGRHAHVALQEVAKIPERGDDILLLYALHVYRGLRGTYSGEWLVDRLDEPRNVDLHGIPQDAMVDHVVAVDEVISRACASVIRG